MQALGTYDKKGAFKQLKDMQPQRGFVNLALPPVGELAAGEGVGSLGKFVCLGR